MYDYLKKQYELGKIDSDYLKKVESKGIISENEYKEISNESYD